MYRRKDGRRRERNMTYWFFYISLHMIPIKIIQQRHIALTQWADHYLQSLFMLLLMLCAAIVAKFPSKLPKFAKIKIEKLEVAMRVHQYPMR